MPVPENKMKEISFKENDIRPEALMRAKEGLLEEDKEFLRSRRAEFVSVGCPACGINKSELWGEKEGFSYYICEKCRTVYMSPRPSQALMHEFYKQSKNYEFWNKYIFPASEDVRQDKIFRPRAKKIVDYCKKFGVKGGTILEIGSAFGTFCESVIEQDYFSRVIAVEPTPALAETCRGKGVEVFEAPVESLELLAGIADVVVNFEVIEHLFDPSSFIKQCVKYLRKGGLFICACPNIEALGTFVLKEKAKVIDHEHVNYFNTRSIKLLFEESNLEVVDLSTPGELDAELLKKALNEDEKLRRENPFFNYLLFDAGDDAVSRFQEFLKESRLSSHMWIVGRNL